GNRTNSQCRILESAARAKLRRRVDCYLPSLCASARAIVRLQLQIGCACASDRHADCSTAIFVRPKGTSGIGNRLDIHVRAGHSCVPDLGKEQTYTGSLSACRSSMARRLESEKDLQRRTNRHRECRATSVADFYSCGINSKAR